MEDGRDEGGCAACKRQAAVSVGEDSGDGEADAIEQAREFNGPACEVTGERPVAHVLHQARGHDGGASKQDERAEWCKLERWRGLGGVLQ